MTLRRAFWVAFTTAMAVYLTMIYWSLPTISDNAGGLIPFDMRPGGYTADEARSFLVALDAQGRQHYLGVQQWLDTLYPGLLALYLILAYFLLFPRRWAAGFSVVAAMTAIFDWRENALVAGLLRQGAGAVDDQAVANAALFTMLKSGATTVAFTLLLAGLAMVLWRRWKGTSG